MHIKIEKNLLKKTEEIGSITSKPLENKGKRTYNDFKCKQESRK